MSDERLQEDTREAVLHIYPLTDEHGDARIIGSRRALTALRDQLNHIVEGDSRFVHRGYYPADGEGYDLIVDLLDRGCHDSAWEQRPEPYYVSRKQAREHGLDI